MNLYASNSAQIVRYNLNTEYTETIFDGSLIQAMTLMQDKLLVFDSTTLNVIDTNNLQTSPVTVSGLSTTCNQYKISFHVMKGKYSSSFLQDNVLMLIVIL